MTAPVDVQQQDVTRNVDVNLRSNVDQYVTGMNQAEVATTRTALAVDALDQKVRGLGQRIQGGLLRFSERDFAALSVGVAAAATYDKQLSTLNATAAVTGQRFAGIKGAVEGTFTSLPTSRTNIIQLIETINDLGVTGAKQLGQLAQTFIKLGEATGEGPNELAQGLIQLSRLMGTTDAGKIAQYANSLLTVSKNAGVSATGVLSFAQSIAPLARQAGIGEASVLGISAAFSKAGADGFVAANTFNSMVSDITKLIQTGSPDLAKYANLIGVTQKQLRTMDKTTAITDIFETINKQGPDAINTLNRLGIDGVRAQAAIAAVVQSGDLSNQIAKAQGSAGNTKNLDKGSKAARDNLADDLARIRNEMTQFGTEIGETFVGPLKLAATTVLELLQALNAVVKPFAPLIAFFASLAGAVAGVAGAVAGLSHLVVAGGALALLARSGPMKAFRGGMAAGRPVVGETEEARVARLAANPSAVMYAGGRMPLRARIPYQFGRGIGEVRGPIDPAAPAGGPGAIRQAARFAVRAPGMAVGAVFRSQSRFLADAGTRDPYARSAYSGARAGAVGAMAPRTFAVSSSGVAEETRSAHSGARAGTPGAVPPRTFAVSSSGVAEESVARKSAIASMRDWTRSQVAANKASLESEGTVKAFTKSAIDATKSVAQFGLQTAKTGASLVTGGRVGGGASVVGGAVGAAERGAAAGAPGVLQRLGSGLKNTAVGMGPMGWGMIAAMVAPSLYGAMNKPNENFKVDNTNTTSKYDQLLGTTSTNLAKFSGAVDDAAKHLGEVAGMTLQQVSTVGPADKSAVASGYKVTDDNYTRLAKVAPTNVKAAVGYIQGQAVQHGGMDSQYLNAIKDDLISAYGPDQAQKILNAYMATKPGGSQANIDYRALGTGLHGTGGTNFNKVSDQVVSQLESQGQVAPGKGSSRAQLGGLLNFLGTSISGKYTGNTQQQIEHARALLAKEFHGNESDYVVGGANGAGLGTAETHLGKDAYSTTAKTQTRVLEALGLTKGGRQFLASAGIDWKKISQMSGSDRTTALQQIIATTTGSEFPNANASELAGRVRNTGTLGRFAEAQGGVVQKAYNQPGDPNEQYAAQMALYNRAGGGSKSFDQVTGAFDKLTSTIGDTTDQLYIMARAAKSYAQQQEQYALPYMSRSQQFGQVSKDYRQAQITQRDNPSPDSAADLQAAQATYQQQLQAQQQYELQVYQQARQFHDQMKRAAQDYHTQTYRAERDFNIQMAQSDEDYNISRERSLRDHARQLTQQAATSAQSIYNPYQRTQPVPTNGAGTLEFNLGDENARLRRQRQELDALHKAGLSTQAIQTLDLANPQNAQQLDRLMLDIQGDPSIIATLNAQTATRVRLTRSLTQNNYNLGFAQSQQNFQTGLSDAANDFNRQRERAVEAQNRSLNDMGNDYNRMVRRAGHDLTLSMTELYGSFADNYGNTLSAINKDIGKYAPELARTLTTELTQVHDAINNTVVAATNTGGNSGSASSRSGSLVAGRGHYAMGAISTQHHVAEISEGNRPEMVLPLDARGQQFMASLYTGITSHLVKTLNGRGYASRAHGGGASVGGGSIHVDQSTNFTGPVSVAAQDVNDMLRQLQQKARVDRLSSPARTNGR